MPTPVWKPIARLPASGPIAGIVWMTISMALMAALAAFARAAMNAGLHPFQVVFLRNLFATLMLSPLLAVARSLARCARASCRSTACVSPSRCSPCRPGSTRCR